MPNTGPGRVCDILVVFSRNLNKRKQRARSANGMRPVAAAESLRCLTHGTWLPRWRNRQSRVPGHRPGSMFSSGQPPGRVDRLHVTSPLAASTAAADTAEHSSPVGRITCQYPARTYITRASPAGLPHLLSPAPEKATICRLSWKNETQHGISCHDND